MSCVVGFLKLSHDKSVINGNIVKIILNKHLYFNKRSHFVSKSSGPFIVKKSNHMIKDYCMINVLNVC